MDAADELKQKCLFDLHMAVDGREERVCHIVILLRIFLDLVDLPHLRLRELGHNLVPDLDVIEFLSDLLLFLLNLLLFLLKLIELVVLDLDVDGNED